MLRSDHRKFVSKVIGGGVVVVVVGNTVKKYRCSRYNDLVKMYTDYTELTMLELLFHSALNSQVFLSSLSTDRIAAPVVELLTEEIFS